MSKERTPFHDRADDRDDSGDGFTFGTIGVISACMLVVALGGVTLPETAEIIPIAEPAFTISFVPSAYAVTPATAVVQARADLTPVEEAGLSLTVPVGTPYPAPAESATSGNVTDLTY